MIGTGKPSASSYRLMPRVLVITRQNRNELKNFRKWTRPAQGLPVMPKVATKSLKASCTPYMGT